MTATAKTYRYHLPQKALKSDCPQCGPKYRKSLSRFVDAQTGELLPDVYGRCDRESNCGYYLSPYQPEASGLSYAQRNNPRHNEPPIPKAWFRMAGKWKRNGVARRGMVEGFQEPIIGATAAQAEAIAAFIYDKPHPSNPMTVQQKKVFTIPDEVFTASLGRYEQNQFAHLLTVHFVADIATQLLQRFQIGTSSHWPGACVFWYIDEQNRKRGGQIKLFDEQFHTAKYMDKNGEKRSKTTWVHSAYARRCDARQQLYPDWLTDYLDEANQVEKSPCLFGLPQLQHAPVDQPIAIVEAPKTAVICTHYFEDFVWMAVGALSYLNAERLSPLKGRSIMLFPDLSTDGSAFARWSQVAAHLNRQGFTVEVSTLLEENGSDEQRSRGYDLADFLLEPDTTQVVADERIDIPVTEFQSVDLPAEECITQPTAFKLPTLIEHYWSLFERPPFWWNKIAAHRALLRYLETDEVQTEPRTVATIEEQYAHPSSILQPSESQIERLTVPALDSYPADWDEPAPLDAVPVIEPLTFHQWQQQHPSFKQLGLGSLPKTIQL